MGIHLYFHCGSLVVAFSLHGHMEAAINVCMPSSNGFGVSDVAFVPKIVNGRMKMFRQYGRTAPLVVHIKKGNPCCECGITAQ